MIDKSLMSEYTIAELLDNWRILYEVTQGFIVSVSCSFFIMLEVHSYAIKELDTHNDCRNCL